MHTHTHIEILDEISPPIPVKFVHSGPTGVITTDEGDQWIEMNLYNSRYPTKPEITFRLSLLHEIGHYYRFENQGREAYEFTLKHYSLIRANEKKCPKEVINEEASAWRYAIKRYGKIEEEEKTLIRYCFMGYLLGGEERKNFYDRRLYERNQKDN